MIALLAFVIPACGTSHDLGDAGAPADARSADAAIGGADAPAAGRAFVYTSGYGGVGGLSLDLGTGALTALPGAWPVTAGGDNLLAIAIDPTGAHLYAAAFSNGVVSAYSIDHATGALTHVGDVTVPGGASYVAMDPMGRAIYVSEYTGDALAVYTIGATGALTAAGSIPVVASPRGIAIDPSGRTLAVAGCTGLSCSISMCTLDAGGAPTKEADVAADNGTAVLAFDASGTRLYATATNVSKLQLYDVVPATASASLRTSITTDPAPLGIALAHGGSTLYVANEGHGVERFAIAADGTPSAVAAAPVGSMAVRALAVDPSGGFALASDDTSQLGSFAIDATTGALTPVAQMTDGVFNGYVVAIVK